MGVFELYWLFFKYGVLCFGGGYMLVPLLNADLVESRGLLTAAAFGDLVSVAQITPGPIAINTATYVGYLQQGVLGAVVATVGIVTPALVLVIASIRLLKRYEATIWVRGFLHGIRPASWGLILSAAVVFGRLSVWGEGGLSWSAAIICLVVLLLQLRTKISFYWLLLGSALFGALFCRTL